MLLLEPIYSSRLLIDLLGQLIYAGISHEGKDEPDDSPAEYPADGALPLGLLSICFILLRLKLGICYLRLDSLLLGDYPLGS